jgi:hypothetical protein
MVKIKINLLILTLILLNSCSFLIDEDEPKEKAKVTITNYTLEKIKVDYGEYFLFKPLYHYIEKDESGSINVELGKSVTAIGDVSGKVYGSRSFPYKGDYTWIIVK